VEEGPGALEWRVTLLGMACPSGMIASGRCDWGDRQQPNSEPNSETANGFWGVSMQLWVLFAAFLRVEIEMP